jgi:aminoglycoside 2''-phosphotransferase
VGYPRLPGEPLWRETLQSIGDPLIVVRLAQQLGEFLRSLHHLPDAELIPLSLPVVDTRADCNDLYGRIRDKLFAHMRPEARRQVILHFEAFLGEADHFAFQPALKHGDFGPSNILYNASEQKVCAIIDFSGAALGYPAYDFAGPLSGYGESFVREWGAAYTGLDALLPRARFYQGNFALVKALFGIENGDVRAFENGIAGFR